MRKITQEEIEAIDWFISFVEDNGIDYAYYLFGALFMERLKEAFGIS